MAARLEGKLHGQADTGAGRLPAQQQYFPWTRRARQCCQQPPDQLFGIGLAKRCDKRPIGREIDGKAAAARLGKGLQLGHSRRRDCGKIAAAMRQCKFAAFQPGKALKLFEAGEKMRGIAGNRGGKGAIFVRCGAEQLLLDDFGKALDGINRRAQLMQQLAHAVGIAFGSLLSLRGCGQLRPSHAAGMASISAALRIEAGDGINQPVPGNRRCAGDLDVHRAKRLMLSQRRDQCSSRGRGA